MQIKEIMTSDAVTCRLETDLAAVAKIMWDRDCGFVPVLDAAGTVAGVITDRDICIASATRHMLPEQIEAAQAMKHQPIHTAQPEDTTERTLATMKQFQVRRLPVVDADGTLKGVISVNDLVLASKRKGGPAASEIVSTLAAICAHRPTAVATA